MKKKISVCSVIFIALFSSCNNGNKVINEDRNKYESKCKLIEFKKKEFKIDDQTSYMTEYIQYIDKDSIDYLAFVNTNNNSVYFYKYSNSSFLKKITFEKEGNNGVNAIQAFLDVNRDSLFVYSYTTQILNLFDNNLNVIKRYKLYEDSESEKSDIIPPSPYMQTATPIRKIGDKIICMGFVAGEPTRETNTNRPVCIVYDLKKDKRESKINYPIQYSKYNWTGGFTYRMPYYDVVNKDIIVSFAASHNLIRYNIDTGKSEEFYAGSSSVNEISSYPQSKGSQISRDDSWRWYMTNASYENIMYDRYRKVYYRIARLPKKDYNSTERGNKKPIVIIILDSNLKYIGETTLPSNENWFSCNSFVSREGLNIQVLSDNEDIISFKTFKIEKL